MTATTTNSFRDYFTLGEIGFIQANLTKTLCENPAVLQFIRNLWMYNYKQIGFERIPEAIFTYIAQAQNIPHEITFETIQSFYKDKEFLKHCKDTRMHTTKMSFSYDCIAQYFDSTVHSFMDVGCGRLALIRRLVRENTALERIYGYDPKSNPSNLGIDPRVVFISDPQELEAIKNIDVIFTSFVFHHLTEKEIQENLAYIKQALSPEGIFICIDETFSTVQTPAIQRGAQEFLATIGYKQNSVINDIFLSLTTREKFLAIYLNDVLNNLKHMHYMPWTFEYHTIEQWSEIISSVGLERIATYDLGVIESDRLKQGITAMLVFKNKS